ncbi:MAG TPA: HAMP domain-containing sensor histidine kinase [Baekduia sp.]|uniref:sensor histidine kinase n=1 Tax=Baekduia sp. TaxID=2600305 RepID=UPI002D7A3E7F|nr:HAMP domain-containing sensor histidine kinase [Baekduia sp.]HET6508260.1 HAMP domain-containing sensor histidine kinase [Baekduia sp.]
MSSEADVDQDGHGATADDRRRPPSRWWRSRAQSAADDAIAEPSAEPVAAADPRQRLADVGHELKTPLSITLALCSRLEDSGRLAPEDAEDVARIRANAYTMLRRVQDLMLVARLESADHQLEAAVVDAAAIVRTCVEGFGELAAQRALDLRLDLPDRLAAIADEEKLVSVVSNLMANAIRHAPVGGVVRCSLSTASGRLVLDVADNGPGVPVDLRETIFERYHRGARSAGTGLGLAIVGEIVSLHGGTVAVGDAPEGGALFTVELPLRTQRLSPQRTPSAPQRSLALADRQKAIVEELRAELGTA